MMTTISNEERGLLFKNGSFVKALKDGKYYAFFGRRIETVDINGPIFSELCSLETLLKDEIISEEADVIDVKDQEIALHYIDGKYAGFLLCGKHAFWNLLHKHEFKVYDMSIPETAEEIPEYIFSKLPKELYIKSDVAPYQKARLYIDNKFERLLEAGTYYFWKLNDRIRTEFADTRLIQMNINGQEVLTQDKVTIRVNFVLSYSITDFIKQASVDNYENHIHVMVQLALREVSGGHKIDEILENKDIISKYVLEKLKEKENDYYISVKDAGVKDIILPGEIRDIMNTVLIAEKRAQANVITRREEVASTRSLLNTARLMDENKTLYKLKELEYIEKICSHVGNINLNGNNDLLAQLSAAFREGM
ncbi:slipin family protein [Anaerotignum faecicola]|nr:slipin family protein [Anaerotignum faecicola]